MAPPRLVEENYSDLQSQNVFSSNVIEGVTKTSNRVTSKGKTSNSQKY